MKAANSSGVISGSSAPEKAELPRTSGSERALLISAFSLLRIWGDVPTGAKMPLQVSRPTSGYPASLAVGTVGNSSLRCLHAAIIARNGPLRACGAS